MAEGDLARLERVGLLRRVAQERRLAETRRLVDVACHSRDLAQHGFRQAVEHEQAVAEQCYAHPADAQAWIARQHRTRLAEAAHQRAQALNEEAELLAERKSEEARALLRGDARLGAIRQRLAAARRDLRAREEDMMNEEFATRLPGGSVR